MPKPRTATKPRAKKKSKLAKALRPFALAFVVGALLVAALVAYLREGAGGAVPDVRVTLTIYPLLAVAAIAALGVAYWRGGKPAFWGTLVAFGAGVAILLARPALLSL